MSRTNDLIIASSQPQTTQKLTVSIYSGHCLTNVSCHNLYYTCNHIYNSLPAGYVATALRQGDKLILYHSHQTPHLSVFTFKGKSAFSNNCICTTKLPAFQAQNVQYFCHFLANFNQIGWSQLSHFSYKTNNATVPIVSLSQ